MSGVSAFRREILSRGIHRNTFLARHLDDEALVRCSRRWGRELLWLGPDVVTT
eukprot:gene20635-biopygen5600